MKRSFFLGTVLMFLPRPFDVPTLSNVLANVIGDVVDLNLETLIVNVLVVVLGRLLPFNLFE